MILGYHIYGSSGTIGRAPLAQYASGSDTLNMKLITNSLLPIVEIQKENMNKLNLCY